MMGRECNVVSGELSTRSVHFRHRLFNRFSFRGGGDSIRKAGQAFSLTAMDRSKLRLRTAGQQNSRPCVCRELTYRDALSGWKA
jgi:hypothetical protein